MAKKTAELSYAQFRISMNLTLLESFFLFGNFGLFPQLSQAIVIAIACGSVFRLFFVTRDLYVPAAHLEHIM